MSYSAYFLIPLMTTHSGMGPDTSIINQENASTNLPTGNLMETFSQSMFSLLHHSTPRVQLTNTSQHCSHRKRELQCIMSRSTSCDIFINREDYKQAQLPHLRKSKEHGGLH